MKEKLTAKELISIIKACKDSGVYKITLDSVNIEFGAPVEANQWQSYQNSTFNSLPATPGQEELNKESQLPDELAEFHLAVSDPLAFEKRILESTE